MRTICRFLGPVFLAAALGLYVYVPGLDCDQRAKGGCGPFDIGIGGDLGMALNFGIVVLLAIAGLSLWSVGQKPR